MTRGLAPAACAMGPKGTHYHQLIDLRSGKPMQFGFQHDWERSTGHPTSPDPARPHQHAWSESELRRELRGHLDARTVEDMARTLAGSLQCGPSTAEKPGGVSYLDREEAVAMTLHPELRPAKLRDL